MLTSVICFRTSPLMGERPRLVWIITPVPFMTGFKVEEDKASNSSIILVIIISLEMLKALLLNSFRIWSTIFLLTWVTRGRESEEIYFRSPSDCRISSMLGICLSFLLFTTLLLSCIFYLVCPAVLPLPNMQHSLYRRRG